MGWYLPFGTVSKYWYISALERIIRLVFSRMNWYIFRSFDNQGANQFEGGFAAGP